MKVDAMRGARKIVETCAGVEADEQVLVVSDWETMEVGECIASAARELNAEVTMTLMTPREHDGHEPTAPVADAMQSADVIFLPVKRSMGHAQAKMDADDESTRVMAMSKFTIDQLIYGGINCDYEEWEPKARRMADKLTDADEAHLVSESGTDVKFGLEGREGGISNAIARNPGQSGSVSHLEANISPVEGTTRGTIVIDGSIPNLDIGVLENNVELKVEEGFVTDIRGGMEAEKIARVWEQYDDQSVYNIAQLAVGMNPECEDFNGWFTNEHGVYGSAHIGIGKSTFLGGEVKAPVHFDGMISSPTLKLDGEVVMEDREFPFLEA